MRRIIAEKKYKKNKTISEKLKICFAVVVVVVVVVVVGVGVKLIKGERQKNKQIDLRIVVYFFMLFVLCLYELVVPLFVLISVL